MSEPAALYHEAIVRTAREAIGAGELDPYDGRALVDNPLCGDRVVMEVSVEGPRLAALAHQVRGCLLCEAAASVIGRRAPGESSDRLREIAERVAAAVRGDEAEGWTEWPELEIFRPVVAFRSRHRCVTLPFEALGAALTDAG